jgi:hypothetical protein
MTALEACALLVDTVRDLSATRAQLADVEAERKTLREINHAAIEELHVLTRRVQRQDETIVHLHEMLRAQRRQERAA